jgi:hypothetical protein
LAFACDVPGGSAALLLHFVDKRANDGAEGRQFSEGFHFRGDTSLFDDRITGKEDEANYREDQSE